MFLVCLFYIDKVSAVPRICQLYLLQTSKTPLLGGSCRLVYKPEQCLPFDSRFQH